VLLSTGVEQQFAKLGLDRKNVKLNHPNKTGLSEFSDRRKDAATNPSFSKVTRPIMTGPRNGDSARHRFKSSDGAIKPMENQVTLKFEDNPDLLRDISCVAAAGRSLFLANDETAFIERLSRVGENRYAAHVRFDLADFFDLPDGQAGEADIEGLAVSDGWLWVTGSHSLKRKKPDRDKHDATHALQRMSQIDRDPNRYLLARLPLAADGENDWRPVRRDGDRHAAAIKLKKKRSKLIDWLRADPHLGAFLDIASKENGFDVEGITGLGQRCWLGLRGPTLRGHAVVIELDCKLTKKGHLKPRKIDDGRRYRKHLLDTRGLGIRDLDRDGTDILILTGPTMDSDGPAHVLRWRQATQDTTSGVIDPDRIEHVMELPYRGTTDHPEGIELVEIDRRDHLLVVHDSPHPDRLDPQRLEIRADLLAIPG